MHDTLLNKLQHTFGFSEFRPGQMEAIQTLLTKGKLLCILPTGYGKSLLYQLPAMLLDGMTIVISPLLALMRDQIHQLNSRFNIPSAAINSDQSDEENFTVRQKVLERKIKILFIAPEQLDHIDRFNFLLNLPISFVVIDEAHCISTWGHDFRPSYRKIVDFIQAIQKKSYQSKILALTATANNRVESDICSQIFFSKEQSNVIRQSLARENIFLSVIPVRGMPAKLAACENLLRQIEGSGLIYCATRENAELVADYLKDTGFNVTAYHAGFENEQKIKLQQEFISDKYKALTATNALGMGIDKGNLRFIIHFDFPGSITAYYQEVGRCGRDGKKSQGIMFYDWADRIIHQYFIDSAIPSEEDFNKVLTAVTTATVPPGLTSIKSLTGLHPTRATIVIAELVEQGFIFKQSQNGKQVYYRSFNHQGQVDLSRYEIQKQVKEHELQQILNYGKEKDKCRMTFLRNALGDLNLQPCKQCDICTGKHLNIEQQHEKIIQISSWINERPLIISPVAKLKISQGISILDSKLRSNSFIHFMKNRANTSDNFGLDEELVQIIKKHLENLSKKYRFSGIVPIPSRTWSARIKIAEFIGQQMQIPILDVLDWLRVPEKRQGELLNNDQRHDNVHQSMKSSTILQKGSLLLLDDYIGSGNTMKEAARALRASSVSNELIPVTIASLKWHLGKSGYV